MLPPLAEQKTEYRTRWYGWQTLIADGASVGLMVGGAVGQADAALMTGIVGYVLAAPIVHFGHGNAGRGFLSMGLRLGMPLGLGFGFAAAADCSNASSDSYCGLGEFAIGMLVGMAGASAIDAAALAREKVPVQPSVAVVPMLGRDHAGLAIGGTF